MAEVTDEGVQNDDLPQGEGDVADDESNTESELKKSLDEWDEQQRESFLDPDPGTEFEPRDPEEIAALETRIESLEGDLSAATERGDVNEELAGFIGDAVDRLDRHDFDRAIEHLVQEAGVDSRVAELELKQRLLEDPDFLAAADDRFDNPDRFNAMLSEFEDDLVERYPRNDDHGLTSAVMAARDVSVSRDHGGEFSEVDWSRLSDQQFRLQAREVLAAQKAGRIRNKVRGGGGWFTTSPK